VPKSFEAFGVPVRLTLDVRGVEGQVLDILPPGWRPSRPKNSAAHFVLSRVDPDIYEVRVADQVWLGQAPLDMALEALDAQIRLRIAANAADWTFVRAGVVAWQGKALLIPSDSFGGKTTLVKALVEAGATYYSDEYGVLDDDGHVHPYPRRLSLPTHGRTLGGSAADARAQLSTGQGVSAAGSVALAMLEQLDAHTADGAPPVQS
jgi:hypothetical protein